MLEGVVRHVLLTPGRFGWWIEWATVTKYAKFNTIMMKCIRRYIPLLASLPAVHVCGLKMPAGIIKTHTVYARLQCKKRMIVVIAVLTHVVKAHSMKTNWEKTAPIHNWCAVHPNCGRL